MQRFLTARIPKKKGLQKMVGSQNPFEAHILVKGGLAHQVVVENGYGVIKVDSRAAVRNVLTTKKTAHIGGLVTDLIDHKKKNTRGLAVLHRKF